jgi:hypothetical protein
MAALLITAARVITTPAQGPTRAVSPGYVRVADGDHRARTAWAGGQKLFGGGS